MDITVKRFEVRNIIGALSKLSEIKLPVRVDYFRARNLKLLQSEFETSWEVQRTKLKDYYTRIDELRKVFKETEPKEELKALNETFKDTIAEVESFLQDDIKVSVHMVTIDVFGDLTLPQGIMDTLQLLIVEDIK